MLNLDLQFEKARAIHDYIKTNASETYFAFVHSCNDTEFTNSIADTQIQNLPAHRTVLMNKVSGLDVIMCFKRNNWIKDIVIPQYEPSFTTSNNCIILTSEFKVYKCLWNANGSNTKKEPNHTSFSPQNYSDGYRWKFLYQLSARDIHNFLTDTYVPIHKDFELNTVPYKTEYNAIGGEIQAYDVSLSGAGYTNANIVIVGGGTGATAIPVIQGGVIKAIKVTNPGHGYTKTNVVINGDGTGAKAKAIISPTFGHGSNLIRECGADKVMVISQSIPATQENNNIPVEFVYDTVGLISGVKGLPVSDVTIPLCYCLDVEDASAVMINENATINRNSCFVVGKSELENKIYVVRFKSEIGPLELFKNAPISQGDVNKTNVLNVSEPVKIKSDYNILDVEFVNHTHIENKNIDIIRLVIQ